MNTEEITLVQESWKKVSQLDMEIVGRLFYSKLFELAPQVQPMFYRSTMQEQSKKLLTMIGYIISKLNRLEDILDEVTKLAQRHIEYGVKEDHYAIAGQALLWTLEKGLGNEWTPATATAWTKCYNILSSAMINCSEKENNVL